MASSLIRGKYVVAKVTSRTEAEVIADGAVFQENGVGVDVGPYAELAARHRPDQVLGSSDHVVVPGFVNGHHHVGLTPFQLGSPDYALELWFASRMAARAVDPYLDTLYSAFEMLESGITTVQHLHGWRIGPAARVIEVADRVLRAYDDVGMRVSYSYALRDQNRLAYEADDAFAARFPAPVSGQLREYLRAQAIPIDDHHGIFTDLWEKCGRNTRPRPLLSSNRPRNRTSSQSNSNYVSRFRASARPSKSQVQHRQQEKRQERRTKETADDDGRQRTLYLRSRRCCKSHWNKSKAGDERRH